MRAGSAAGVTLGTALSRRRCGWCHLSGSADESRRQPDGPGTALRRSDKPVRIKHVSVIELNYNIQTVVDSLKLQSRPVWERRPHFLCYTRGVRWHGPFGSRVRLDGLPPRLCDGRHRIAEIVPRLSATLHDVKAPLREYVCLRLLSGAQGEQFIDIYRNCVLHPKRTRSHGTAP